MTFEGLYKDQEEKWGRNVYILLHKFMGLFAVFENFLYAVWRKTTTALRA